MSDGSHLLKARVSAQKNSTALPQDQPNHFVWLRSKFTARFFYACITFIYVSWFHWNTFKFMFNIPLCQISLAENTFVSCTTVSNLTCWKQNKMAPACLSCSYLSTNKSRQTCCQVVDSELEGSQLKKFLQSSVYLSLFHLPNHCKIAQCNGRTIWKLIASPLSPQSTISIWKKKITWRRPCTPHHKPTHS